MSETETQEPAQARSARTAITLELAERYQDIERTEAELQFAREEFYRDVARLRRQFTPESLAARVGVTRDAVYQWRKRGRALLKGVCDGTG